MMTDQTEFRGSMAALGVRAANAYAMAQHATVGGREILLALHRGLYDALVAAKFAYEKGALDKMCLYTQRVMRIVLALKGNLKFELAGPDGRVLARFYDFLLTRSMKILRHPDPAGQFQSMLDMLRPFIERLIATGDGGAVRPTVRRT